MLWEIYSERVLIDVISIRMNCDMSIAKVLSRLFKLLFMEAAALILFTGHLVNENRKAAGVRVRV